jgi:hypothetical protein
VTGDFEPPFHWDGGNHSRGKSNGICFFPGGFSGLELKISAGRVHIISFPHDPLETNLILPSYRSNCF